MMVGDKVLIEATVTMVGDDICAVAITGLQGIEHIRILKAAVQEPPKRAAKTVLKGGEPAPVAA